ncbi:pyroglutamyl-peptidase I [Microbacterium sp. Marseille-Q6965]|uniref:pyroglutamyl-peptidase I n=1 Tax=Microbacterium sp. Marseille-Q6965 TaxID=2965072 RepID=UPI0021B81E07|nr:pyroglutamyl-peptidase I [Microbacterium sp. Marseille-Q6965]
MVTILLTGFEPFGGDARNPSGEAVEHVVRAWDGPERLVPAILPVSFDAAAEQLRALIGEHDPQIVVASGLAGGRTQVTPERVAINLRDARIPDNAGAQPLDEPSVAGGPAAYFATLPVKAIAQAIREAGVPAAVSHTAGTFVCNHVMYVAADEASRRPGMRTGFVHVPWSADTAPADAPSLPARDIAHALRIAVRIAVDAPADAAVTAGTLH